MRLPPILFLLATATGLVASAVPAAHAGGLPVCSAKHKRPANAYGSVLSEGLKPALGAAAPTGPAKPLDAPVGAATAAAAAAAMSAAVKPQRVSRAEWRASFAPCGSDRA